MPVSFFSMPRPARKTVTVEVAGVGPFTFESLGAVEQLAALEMADALWAEYGDEAPIPFPAVDGKPVRVSKKLFQACALLYCAYVGEPIDVREWVAMSVTLPDDWSKCVEAINVLNSGNSPSGASVGWSAPPSTSPSDTPS